MENHPIEGLMKSAMDSIQNMVDVNTIIGEPIETSNNMVIIPISKVCFGFAAGGSEFKGETVDEYKKKEKEEEIQYRLPFGGGSGAGVSITPVAFVVITQDSIKLMPVEHASTIDKLLDYVPDFMEKANAIANKTLEDRKNKKNEEEPSDNNKSKETVKIKKPSVDRKSKDTVKEVEIEYDETNKAEEYLEDE